MPIEHCRQLAAGQHGHAEHAFRRGKISRKRLDQQGLDPQNGIHRQRTQAAVRVIEQQHRPFLLGIETVRRKPDDPLQPVQRRGRLVGQCIMNASIQRNGLILRRRSDIFQPPLFQHINAGGGFDQQRGHKIQIERNAQGNGQAPPGLRMCGQMPAQRQNLSFDHIQAHATPGQLRGLIACTETGRKNQQADGVVVEPVGLLRVDKSARYRFGLDPRIVQTAAIIGDTDPEFIMALGKAQHDTPGFRLAQRQALFRRLQTMIDGVAQHM